MRGANVQRGQLLHLKAYRVPRELGPVEEAGAQELLWKEAHNLEKIGQSHDTGASTMAICKLQTRDAGLVLLIACLQQPGAMGEFSVIAPEGCRIGLVPEPSMAGRPVGAWFGRCLMDLSANSRVIWRQTGPSTNR